MDFLIFLSGPRIADLPWRLLNIFIDAVFTPEVSCILSSKSDFITQLIRLHTIDLMYKLDV
jgi:hypothetical protein